MMYWAWERTDDMKRNLMPLLAVAFIAAVAATGIFYGLMLPRFRAGGGRADAGRKVAAAIRNLDRGSVLKAEDIALVEVPDAETPKSAVRDPEQLIGLTLLEPVAARRPLHRGLVSPRGQTGGPSLAVPAGMRVVSIHPASSAGIVALLESGSRVDVLVLEPRPNGQPSVLRRLLEDVEVLGVTRATGGAGPEVTVVAGLQDAERLILADASMPLRIALRNPGDREQSGPEALTPDRLFDRGAAALRPAEREPVQARLQ